MKIENKRSEITRLIDNIKKHSDYLEELETIPVLEIGVILSKINKLHEEAAILKYLCEIQQGKRVILQSSDLVVTNIDEENNDNEASNTEPDTSIREEELEQDAMLSVKNDKNIEALDHMFEAANETEDDEMDNSVEQESSADFFAEKTVEPEEPEESENSVEDENTEQVQEETTLSDSLLDQILEEAKETERNETLVDKLEVDTEISSKPDVNEVFSAADSSISDHLQKQPITDLMSSIGLNERYLYANDLFDGDMQEFKNAIKMLNEFENGEEAKAFFESGLRSTYNWEDDNPLAVALSNLVERRYL